MAGGVGHSAWPVKGCPLYPSFLRPSWTERSARIYGCFKRGGIRLGGNRVSARPSPPLQGSAWVYSASHEASLCCPCPLCAGASPVRPLKRIDCDWPMDTLADSGSCIWAFLACVIAARSRSPPNDRYPAVHCPVATELGASCPCFRFHCAVQGGLTEGMGRRRGNV